MGANLRQRATFFGSSVCAAPEELRIRVKPQGGMRAAGPPFHKTYALQRR